MTASGQASASAPNRRWGATALAWFLAAALLAVGPAFGQEGVACRSATADTQPAEPPDAPLTVTFYGVSTLMFSDGRDRILIDGFFSRPRSPVSVQTNLSAIQGALRTDGAALRAVLTAHAHHDHAMDVAVIAGEAPGAVIVGTPSVVTLMTRQGLEADRLCAPADADVLIFGAFKITALFVDHGPPLPFIGWLLDRPMRQGGDPPVWIGGFTDDKNLSFLVEHGGRRILVHPSAGIRDLTTYGADTVFLGAGRLSAMDDRDADRYLTATVGVETKLVVPIHWDRFTTDLGVPLQRTPWPFDDIDRGFEAICRLENTRPGVTLLLMDAGSRLRFPPAEGFAEDAGEFEPLCEPGGTIGGP